MNDTGLAPHATASFVEALCEEHRAQATDASAAEIYRAATAAWPDVSLPATTFLPYIAARLDPTLALDEALAQLRVDDLYLACACAQGDARALSIFEQRFFPDLDAAIARMRDASNLRDDMKQLLREKLFVGSPGKIADYNGRGGLRTWLRVAGVRTMINLLAQRPRELSVDEELLEVACKTGDPELTYLKTEFRSEIKLAFAEALAALPARDHNFLRYALVDGLSIDRIGALYGVHRATAARWLIAARRSLVLEVRRRLGERLRIDRARFDSILNLLESGFEVSLHRLLGAA